MRTELPIWRAVEQNVKQSFNASIAEKESKSYSVGGKNYTGNGWKEVEEILSAASLSQCCKAFSGERLQFGRSSAFCQTQLSCCSGEKRTGWRGKRCTLEKKRASAVHLLGCRVREWAEADSTDKAGATAERKMLRLKEMKSKQDNCVSSVAMGRKTEKKRPLRRCWL